MTGYEQLLTGLTIFMVLHVITGIYSVRTKLVNKLGAIPHRVLHSIGAITGLTLMVLGYADKPVDEIYSVASWGAKAPFILMPVSLFFLVGSHMSDFKTITRHPLLWGIVLWAGAHLLANGDKASLMLFGAFFIYGLLAMALGDDKKAKSNPDEWAKTKAQTSILPFVALLQGRTATPFKAFTFIKAVIGALFLYSLLLWSHGYITGVPLLLV